MDNYINKNEVLNLIMHNDKVCHYADERYENVVYATAQTICRVVADMPATDVQPVKHGRWICTNDYETLAYDTLYYNRCSACGEESLETGDFCPNCGARMLED